MKVVQARLARNLKKKWPKPKSSIAVESASDCPKHRSAEVEKRTKYAARAHLAKNEGDLVRRSACGCTTSTARRMGSTVPLTVLPICSCVKQETRKYMGKLFRCTDELGLKPPHVRSKPDRRWTRCVIELSLCMTLTAMLASPVNIGD